MHTETTTKNNANNNDTTGEYTKKIKQLEQRNKSSVNVVVY